MDNPPRYPRPMLAVLFLAQALALAFLLMAPPVQAQTLNYGKLEALFGEPVTTSATGKPERASDASVNMEIITADDIRRSGADNIPDILRQVAGVDVRRYGASDADVAIRGYNAANSPRVLVLLNGRQIYVDYHSYTAWATVPVQLEEIRQIEVIKGPNTALYGFNAVAGVINIITYDPIYDKINTVTARGGTKNNEQISAVVTSQLGEQAGLRLSASEHGVQEFASDRLPAYGVSYQTYNYNRSFYADGRAVLPSGLELSSEFDMTEAKQLEMAVGGYPNTTKYGTNREKIGIGGQSALGYLNLDAYHNAVQYDYMGGANCATCIGIYNDLVVVQASDLLKLGAKHTLRLGFEYRDNQGSGSAYQDENFGIKVYAADAMWNWQITPTVALTNSVRVDHLTFFYKGSVDPTLMYTASQYNSRPITEPSFNSALLYKPTLLDSLRFSVARGVQAPDFYALFPAPPGPLGAFNIIVNSYQGTPNLRPSVNTNYEIDYDRSLPNLDTKGKLALFYQITRNVLAAPGDAGVTDANNNGYAGNIGGTTSLGGELSLKGANDEGWRWRASYALALIKDHYTVVTDGDIPTSTMNSERGTPTNTITFGLGRTWGDFELDFFGRWQSRYDDIRIATGDANLVRTHINNYLTFDARVGYSLTENVTLALSGQQLNQAYITQTSGQPVARRVLGTLSVHF